MKNILIVKTNMRIIDFGSYIMKEKEAINTDKIRLITGKDIKKLVNIDNSCEFNNFIKTSEYDTLIFMCETLNFTYKVSKCINDAIGKEIPIKVYSDEVIKNISQEFVIYDNDEDLITKIINDLKPKRPETIMTGQHLYNYRKFLGISLEELSFLTEIFNDVRYTMHNVREFELAGLCDCKNYINFILKLKKIFNTEEKINWLKIFLSCQKNYKLLMYRTLLNMTTSQVEDEIGISDAQINRYERNYKLRPDKYIDLIKFYKNKINNTNPNVTKKCINLLINSCKELKCESLCKNANTDMSLNEYMSYFNTIDNIDKSIENIAKLYNINLDESNNLNNELIIDDLPNSLNDTVQVVYTESDKLDFSKESTASIKSINLIEELKSGKKLINNDLKKENSYLVMENGKLIKYTVMSEELSSLSIEDMLRTDWQELS